jgi:hypothetical protein
MLHDLTLEGYGTRLVPLADEHAEALSAFVDDRLWAAHRLENLIHDRRLLLASQQAGTPAEQPQT